ncbi:spore coat protein [Terribacillus saccharophilus]|uniref:Spore coat protein n=1 Tax=Terribacillus saccharophilus TaxID=361277 RepID=A0A268A8F1_9BACI|nr:spore coat protein [Terribacillus saccharophilus]PAD20404.1 spore coat protein [Terribacillus saccharophilus]PAF18382.1 spore coat protein [Terribacillus saccharophilus]PAF20653.1 spore coat protein [Terribacillus saccharophilus]PAF34294.1 spore coat protein [Terribacillus saccharophilus]PAF35952.1 spore coat protein [Terribacillus saccharophilus]
MSDNQQLAPHETMEVHELLNFKTTAVMKAKFLQGVVFDQKIKQLMEKDVETSVRQIRELEELYSRSQLVEEGEANA